MKVEQRSLKSKEKFADSLMAVANVIHGAALAGVLVFPLTAFVSSVLTGTTALSFGQALDRMTWPNIAIFALVYLTPILMGYFAKEKAMNLFDEVAAATTPVLAAGTGPTGTTVATPAGENADT